MKTLYLSGLNGLRALAAVAVLISHIIQSYGGTGLDLAGFGVTIFFALSGFLITLLLLKEQEKSGTIKIRKFYIRRILRIWPLYFLYFGVVLVTLVCFIKRPVEYRSILYYIFFVPNIPFVIGGAIDFLHHYWSLGVEEQFYGFWPLAARRFLPNGFVAFSLVLIGLLLGIKLFTNLYYGGYSIPYTIAYVCRFDCMAIGGLGAYYFHKQHPIVQSLQNRFVQLVAWGIIALVMLNKFHLFSIVDHEIIAAITVVLIISQIFDGPKVINLENRVCNFLGKISFGLYVYHPFIIFLVIVLFEAAGLNKSEPISAVLYFTTVVFTSIVVAYLSYTFIESYFLKMKTAYAVVKSASSRPANAKHFEKDVHHVLTSPKSALKENEYST